MVAIAAVVFLRVSAFSRHVYAVGGNEKAARLSGVPVIRVKIAVFAICGLLAALAGIVHAGQLNQGSPNDGIGYELDAIAAVVIGGTSLAGGRGSVVGTVAGALLLGVLNNILALNNIDSNIQLLIKGLVIVAAAALQRLRPASVTRKACHAKPSIKRRSQPPRPLPPLVLAALWHHQRTDQPTSRRPAAPRSARGPTASTRSG